MEAEEEAEAAGAAEAAAEAEEGGESCPERAALEGVLKSGSLEKKEEASDCGCD